MRYPVKMGIAQSASISWKRDFSENSESYLPENIIVSYQTAEEMNVSALHHADNSDDPILYWNRKSILQGKVLAVYNINSKNNLLYLALSSDHNK